MRVPALIGLLLAGACCTSPPKLAPKRLAFPAPSPRFERVDESLENWRDPKRDRDVPVKLYRPQGASGKLPVVVFSHGIGEDRDSYAYLGRALARAGYLTAHVTHAGTDRAVLERGYRHLYRATKDPRNWIARPLDVSFVLDRLAERDDADLSRVAVAGHSAGAFTALAIAGLRNAQGESPRDERVKVIVPMSMPRIDVVPPGGYDAITVPTLHMTGTCDTSLIYRTFPRHRRIPFEATKATGHYLVTLDRVRHESFSNVEDAHHGDIARLTIAFLDAWLRDDAAARAWFDEAGADGGIYVERK